MRPLHLARRFFAALWPGPPAAADEEWVAAVLGPDELLLFRRLPNHDRRHAIGVARAVDAQLGPGTDRRWLQAALLHDVGKYAAGLSVVGRALATATADVAGPARVARWDGRRGWRGRVSTYARHGEIGEAEILAVGGAPEVACWAAAHHHPQDFGALPIEPDVVAALDAADYA
jgi:hypothetical protein